MYEYEIFKNREHELHTRAAAERLAREAVAARRAVRSGLLQRVARSVRREAAPRANSGAGAGRSGAASGCAA